MAQSKVKLQDEDEDDDYQHSTLQRLQNMSLYAQDDDDEDDEEAEEQSGAYNPMLNHSNFIDTEQGLYQPHHPPQTNHHPQTNPHFGFPPPAYIPPTTNHSILNNMRYMPSPSDSDSDDDGDGDGIPGWVDLRGNAIGEDSEEDGDGELASFMRRHNLIGTTRFPVVMNPMQRPIFPHMSPHMTLREAVPPMSSLNFDGIHAPETQEEADMKKAIEMSLEQFKIEQEKEKAEKMREEIQKNYELELQRKKVETEVSDDDDDDEDGGVDEDYGFYCADEEEDGEEDVVEEGEEDNNNNSGDDN